MEIEVKIDEVFLFAKEYREETVESEPTGNQLRKLKFYTSITGSTKQKEIEEILNKSSFTLKVPSHGLDIKAKKENAVWSYQGGNLDENTIIGYQIEICELDKDLPEDWSIMGAQYSSIIMNWIRTRALAELLIEKGLTTWPEYEEKIKKVADRDFESLKNYIAYGLPEKKDEE